MSSESFSVELLYSLLGPPDHLDVLGMDIHDRSGNGRHFGHQIDHQTFIGTADTSSRPLFTLVAHKELERVHPVIGDVARDCSDMLLGENTEVDSHVDIGETLDM